MRRTSYQVDCGLSNAPSVSARYDVLDPATGEEKSVMLTFVDGDARAIVPMMPNPSPPVGEDGRPIPASFPGEWDIANPDAPPNLAKLDELARARLAEATTAAATVTERLVQAEEARRKLRDAEIGAQNARAEEEAAQKRKAAIEAEIAKLEQQKKQAVETLPPL